MKQVFDEVRSAWVAATPEEIVRQQWIRRMVGELGFPRALLVVEKELKELPHLRYLPQLFPARRIDLLSYAKDLTPLLLIEFKVEAVSESMLEQVLAYNTFVKAPAVAVANERRILLEQRGHAMRHLPLFCELVEMTCG